MNRIERLFVRAKHWQIFLLFVAVFAVGQLPLIGNFTVAAKSPEDQEVFLVLAQVVGAMVVWCFLVWLWALGSFLASVVPPGRALKKRFFLFTIVCSAIYMPVSIAVFQSIDRMLFIVTIPLHLFGVFCMFCNLYFVAEGLETAETGERPSFLDLLGTFLLLIFGIIGVWFIQPRVNRLYAEKQAAQATA
ncbi:MAG: hypothetical protein ABSC10_16885 [Candidatus Acidiferrales bacterium]|jgi:hypothetical protein